MMEEEEEDGEETAWLEGVDVGKMDAWGHLRHFGLKGVPQLMMDGRVGPNSRGVGRDEEEERRTRI